MPTLRYCGVDELAVESPGSFVLQASRPSESVGRLPSVGIDHPNAAVDVSDVVVNLGDYLQPPTRSNGESDEALMACFNRLQGTLDSLNAENDRQLEADLRAIVYKFPGGGADGSKGPNNRRPAA
ncbi:MAG: hypothetical protein ACK5ZV_07025 [bacterium]|jgi:hypothetical protein